MIVLYIVLNLSITRMFFVDASHKRAIVKILFIFVFSIHGSHAQYAALFGAAVRTAATASRAAYTASLRASPTYQAARLSLSAFARSSAVPPKLATVLKPPRYAGLPSKQPYIESTSSVTDYEFRVILYSLLKGKGVPPQVRPDARVTPLPSGVDSALFRYGVYMKSAKSMVDPKLLVGNQGKSTQWVNGDVIEIANTVRIPYANEHGLLGQRPPPPCDPATVPVGFYCSLYYMHGNPENNGKKSEICGESSCYMLEMECTNNHDNTEFVTNGCYQVTQPGSSEVDWVCSDNCQWECIPPLVFSYIINNCCISSCERDEFVYGCDEGVAILNTSSNSATIVRSFVNGVCGKCLILPGTVLSFTANSISDPCGFMCVPGYYNPVIDFTRGNQPCLECPVGKYGQLLIGSIIILPSQAQGRNWAGICTLCPAGKFSSTFASTMCHSCNTGKYASAEGLGECMTCEPGKYNPFLGSTGCLFCSVGTYQPQYASTQCQSCAINPSIDPGSVSCPPQSAGPFRSLIPMIECPVGKYMEIETNLCVHCPTGTYSTGIGLDDLAWDAYPNFVNTYAYASEWSAIQCTPTSFDGFGAYCTFNWDEGASSTIIVTGKPPVIGVVTRPSILVYQYVTEFTLQRNIDATTSESFVIPGNVGGQPHALTWLIGRKSINVTLRASPRAGQWVKISSDFFVSFMWTVLYSVPPCLSCPAGTFSFENACIPASDFCGRFFYVQNNKCVRCTRECQYGQYAKSQCNGSHDLQCETCPLSCNPGQYMIRSCVRGLPPLCSACNTCPEGMFQRTACDGLNPSVCETCQGCENGKYLSPGSCNGTLNSVCVPCTTCIIGQTYEVRACSGGQNRICGACGSCPSGKYQTQACTLTTPPVCQECTPCIVQGQNLYSDPRNRFPIVTALDLEFETAPCGGPQGDRQCKRCTSCAIGKYASTFCRGTQDNICTDCRTTCPSGQQLVVVCITSFLGSADSYCSNFTAGC